MMYFGESNAAIATSGGVAKFRPPIGYFKNSCVHDDLWGLQFMLMWAKPARGFQIKRNIPKQKIAIAPFHLQLEGC